MISENAYWALPLAFLAACIAYSRWIRTRPKLPPGPCGWPIIGNLNLIGSLPHRSVDRLVEQYGPIMSLRLGSAYCVVASSPDMAREFLKTHDSIFAGRPKLAAGKYTTYNYSDITWSQYNEHWRLARKICLTELFSVKRLDALAFIRVEEVRRALVSIRRASIGGLVHVRDETSTLSNNIISRMAFGKRYLDESAGHRITPKEFKEMIEELFVLNGVFNLGDFIPFLSVFDLQGYVKRMKALSKKLNLFLEEVVEEHSQMMKGVEGFAPQDLVDVLLQLAEDPEVRLSRTRVKAYTQDIIAGGTESSATLIEWALSELLKNPEKLAKLEEELQKVIANERWVEEKDIAELPYLTSVVKETMRLHPVAPFLVPRMSTESCNIAGYDIPMNTRIMVNVWTIARDAKTWDRPLEFLPERFLNNPMDVKGRDFELLPFGSGRRMCPGYSLGYKVVKLALANFVHGFHWKLPPGKTPDDLDMTETFGLSTPKAAPLEAQAYPRLPSHLYEL